MCVIGNLESYISYWEKVDGVGRGYGSKSVALSKNLWEGADVANRHLSPFKH